MSRGTSVLKRVRRRKIPLTEEEETEIGMIQPQVEECQEAAEAGRGKELVFPYRLQRQCGLADTLISYFWPSKL